MNSLANILLSSLAFDKVTILSLVVLFSPLFIFCFLMLLGRIISRYRGILATSIMFICMIVAGYIFSQTWGLEVHHAQFEWFQIGGQKLTLGIYLDNITAFMLLMVTFISFLVHLFSIEYLRGDKHFEKYFAYLGLFTFSMLGILLSDNLLSIFIFWELVGFSSYLLIGFWFQKEEAVFANKKAFLTNKIGDAGFLLGLLIIWAVFGTFDLQTLYANFQELSLTNGTFVISETWLIIAGVGLFLGCVGKSAQFPLQVWLPNAMEGPTPVSALIHAATMVAAGVYLLARIFLLLHIDVLTLISIIGALTAFMGAFVAMSQTDIKKVLAFSTISQLGYMVMAMGVGAYSAGLFHLLTHAFFKACLFLGSGAIIHAMHGLEEKYHIHFDPQDMRLMGGLRKKPVTFITYTIATASLIGLPFFSGFLSKDAILLGAWAWADFQSAGNGFTLYHLIPISGFLTVFLTAFYMGRQWLMVFWGELRLAKKIKGYEDAFNHIRKAPLLMRIPMVLLAILSFAMVFSFNPFSTENSWFHQVIMSPVAQGMSQISYSQEVLGILGDVHAYHTNGIILSISFIVLGLGLAYLVYGSQKETSLRTLHSKLFNEDTFLYKLSYNNWFLDQIYEKTIVNLVLFKAHVLSVFDKYIINLLVDSSAKMTLRMSSGLAWFDNHLVDKFVNYIGYFNVIGAELTGWFDKYIVDGLVRFVAWIALMIGKTTKSFQGGRIQTYLFLSFLISFIFAVIIILLVK